MLLLITHLGVFVVVDVVVSTGTVDKLTCIWFYSTIMEFEVELRFS